MSWVHTDGTLIEGVLDLAFDEGDATVVVDFKTDYELAAGETRYRAQLQQYVNAVVARHGAARARRACSRSSREPEPLARDHLEDGFFDGAAPPEGRVRVVRKEIAKRPGGT